MKNIANIKIVKRAFRQKKNKEVYKRHLITLSLSFSFLLFYFFVLRVTTFFQKFKGGGATPKAHYPFCTVSAVVVI